MPTDFNKFFNSRVYRSGPVACDSNCDAETKAQCSLFVKKRGGWLIILKICNTTNSYIFYVSYVSEING